MKIFAVINNHGITEETSVPTSALAITGTDVEWYEMPDSSILRTGNPFFVPDFDTEFRIYPSLCLRIGRLGKSIARRFAHRYVDGWTMAAAVVAEKQLADLRMRGLPWSRAVAFDRSCMLGNLQPIDTLKEYDVFTTHCGEEVLTYSTEHLRAGIDVLVERISADNTLKNGDLILAGLASAGLLARPDTRLEITTENNLTLLRINIK